MICDFLQQNLSVKCLLYSCLLYVVFFFSILLASIVALQQCIMLVMFFMRWKCEHGLRYELRQQCIMLAMFFMRWKCEHGLRYELRTLCINTQGHYNLASKLMLHNLQHNTVHLFPVLVFKLLNFKVCMSNLYSNATSTTNGCFEAKSFCVLFAHCHYYKSEV